MIIRFGVQDLVRPWIKWYNLSSTQSKQLVVLKFYTRWFLQRPLTRLFTPSGRPRTGSSRSMSDPPEMEWKGLVRASKIIRNMRLISIWKVKRGPRIHGPMPNQRQIASGLRQTGRPMVWKGTFTQIVRCVLSHYPTLLLPHWSRLLTNLLSEPF